MVSRGPVAIHDLIGAFGPDPRRRNAGPDHHPKCGYSSLRCLPAGPVRSDKTPPGSMSTRKESVGMSQRRYRSSNPVVERRRNLMLQALGMAMLIAGAGLMVFKALTVGLRRAPAQRSSSSVTGPSLTECTSMSAPKTPRSTRAPSRSSSAHTASYAGSLTGPGAAASHVGRRPFRASP